MGMSLQIFVGPYLACANPKVETKVKIRGCSNKDCENFGHRYKIGSDKKFCSECGAEARDDVEVTEKWPRVESDTLREEIEERLCTFNWNTNYDDEDDIEKHDYWVPNSEVSEITTRNLWIDSQIEGAWPITDTAHEILKFQEVYAKEIARFKEAYAPGEITVAWGILTAYW